MTAKLQRNPSTLKLMRNAATGKLMRAVFVSDCGWCPVSPNQVTVALSGVTDCPAVCRYRYFNGVEARWKFSLNGTINTTYTLDYLAYCGWVKQVADMIHVKRYAVDDLSCSSPLEEYDWDLELLIGVISASRAALFVGTAGASPGFPEGFFFLNDYYSLDSPCCNGSDIPNYRTDCGDAYDSQNGYGGTADVADA
jgi:hypothetical protein